VGGHRDRLPLAHTLVKLNQSEKTAARTVLSEFSELIVPLLPDEVGVITADGGFNSETVRGAVRGAGSVENIHGASHGDQPSTRRNVKRLDEKRYAIEGYPNYYANGHRELFCACGNAAFSREAWRDKHGRGQVRTTGDCPTCGHISITSGLWREAKNPSRYVRCLAGEQPDLQFGNPLTYYDEMAADYGTARRGRGEGPHGHTLTQRFGHLKGKRWFRRMIDAELDTNVVFSIMPALGLEDIEHRARTAAIPAGPAPAPPSTAPPPALPLAA
jgi:hypothetical protein